MSISTKQKQTRRYREQTCACQEGEKDWEFEINICKLVYLGWRNNNILLYRTGNYIPYPVINHNGKEHENIYIYIYIYIPFAVHMKLPQHWYAPIQNAFGVKNFLIF